MKFKNRGKVYFFDPHGIAVRTGDKVVVETSRGLELAECVLGNHVVPDETVVQPLRSLARIATKDDLRIEEINRRRELWDVCSFFFVAPVEYDEKTVKKRWKEDSAKCMTELAEVLAGIEDFSIEGQEKIVMDWIAEKGYHTGNIMNAFRLTLVGEGKGPHMFDISWVLGKEETLARIKRAVEILK